MAKSKKVIMSSLDSELSASDLKKKAAWIAKDLEERAKACPEGHSDAEVRDMALKGSDVDPEKAKEEFSENVPKENLPDTVDDLKGPEDLGTVTDLEGELDEEWAKSTSQSFDGIVGTKAGNWEHVLNTNDGIKESFEEVKPSVEKIFEDKKKATVFGTGGEIPDGKSWYEEQLREAEEKQPPAVLYEDDTPENPNVEEIDLSLIPDGMTIDQFLNKDIIEWIKDTRLDIDKITQFVANGYIHSQESIFDQLFFAKCWLGELLFQFKDNNPYANEHLLKSRKDIPATADVATDISSELYHFNLRNIESKFIELRRMVVNAMAAVNEIDVLKHKHTDTRLASICKTNSYNALAQSKFLLGRELGKLRIK